MSSERLKTAIDVDCGYAQEVSSRRKDRRKAQLQPGSKEIEGVNGLAWFESRSKREHAQRRPKLLTEVGVPATERRCTTAAITTMVPLRLCGGKLYWLRSLESDATVRAEYALTTTTTTTTTTGCLVLRPFWQGDVLTGNRNAGWMRL